MPLSRTRRSLLPAVAAVAALVAAQAAFAERPVVRYNSQDQAAAKAVVLGTADLGAGWTGGAKKPTVSDPSTCSNWNPRQADLTVTGAAESQFTYAGGGLHLVSTVNVLATPGMVRLDWQRTVVHPKVATCLRETLVEQANAQTRFVSLKRTPFSGVGPMATRYRAVMNYVSGTTKVPVLIDVVLVAKGRTELMLMLTAPYQDRAAADAAERRLVKLQLARVRA
jgi:hypothetical protein